MFLLQLYLKVQTYDVLRGRRKGNTTAVAEEETELVNSYSLTVKFLLETYATNAVIQEAHSGVFGYHRRAEFTELVYAMNL